MGIKAVIFDMDGVLVDLKNWVHTPLLATKPSFSKL